MSYVFPVVGWRGPIVPTHWHSGERGGSDLFAPFGTPVVAMCGGRVLHAGNDPLGGLNVLIAGDDGLTYYYAHLDDRVASLPDVRGGQVVAAGTRLGAVGDSGNARGKGAHLHIGIGHGIRTGSGAGGGCGRDFDAVALLQRVLDASNGAGSGEASAGRLVVRGTDGLGLNLRHEPRITAPVVKLLPEGAPVEPRDRAWRPVRDPTDGATGWVAEEFLASA